MSRQHRPAPVAVIVDDCPAARQTAVSAAHSCGWEAEAFACPDELFFLPFPPDSVSDLCVARVDAFVVSLDLPAMAGCRLVNWLTASERWACVPLAAVTGRKERPPHLAVDSSVPVLERPVAERDLAAFFAAAAALEPPFPVLPEPVANRVSGLLAREVSRARRGDYPFSILLMRPALAFSQGDSPVIGAALLGEWNRPALRSVCRSLRETDVVVDLGADGLLAALPFAGPEALQRLETRLHDALRPLLREFSTGCRARVALATAGATFPEEASGWRSLYDLALGRLESGLEGRSLRSLPPAA